MKQGSHEGEGDQGGSLNKPRSHEGAEAQKREGRRTRWAGIWVLSLVALGGASGGCGYSSERPFRDDVQTVNVQMLQSKEFRRGLEFQLTEALVKRIEMDTPYKIADQRTADTLFTGEILEVRNRTFGQEFRTRLPRETGSTVVVAFRWKDQRSGEILSERQRFVSTSSFIPPAGETFDTGMVRGLDKLAEEIVEAAIETPW